jgi:hypothetical protein
LSANDEFASALTPGSARDIDDQFELCALVGLGNLVAFHDADESTLGADRQPVHLDQS